LVLPWPSLFYRSHFSLPPSPHSLCPIAASSCHPHSSLRHHIAPRCVLWPVPWPPGAPSLIPSGYATGVLSALPASPPLSTAYTLLFFLGSVVGIPFVEALVLKDLFRGLWILFSSVFFPSLKVQPPWCPNPNVNVPCDLSLFFFPLSSSILLV